MCEGLERPLDFIRTVASRDHETELRARPGIALKKRADAMLLQFRMQGDGSAAGQAQGLNREQASAGGNTQSIQAAAQVADIAGQAVA